MIIGVDAGALSISDERLKVGVYRVTYNLLKVLGSIDTKNTYRLYTFLPIPKESMMEFGPQMTNVVLHPSIGWSKIRLPLELSVHPVDIFLGLAQALPKTSAKKIGFIYDLGFFYNPQVYGDGVNKLIVQTDDLVAHADSIVTISESSKKDIVDHYGVKPDEIYMFHPGVDARFNPVGKKHTATNPHILFVGSLTKSKHVPLALQAFRLFLDKIKKQYTFILVGGDYWPDPQIEETVKKLDLRRNVQFAGYVGDEDLLLYYRGAHAFITTACHEGFCLPAVEAMACGTPVVAVDRGAMREIVSAGGILSESDHPDNIAAALYAAVNNPVTRKKLQAQAIQSASHYSWSTFGSSVLHLLENP
jgi:glycosyltransferase involved in cell wall biosynthesis